jgi:diacylglycerol kinase (ATP)
MLIQHIAIIYNPKSSGGSSRAAQELYGDIRKRLPHTGIEVLPTKYAGHAADLAEIVGRTRKNALVVSVGGDGTYHEVINGVMRLPGRGRPACVVLAAGNANDHHSALDPEKELIDRIMEPTEQGMDLLKVSSLNPSGEDLVRYAHSYIGFGTSGRIARALNKEAKGLLSEKWIVFRELMRPQSFEIIEKGKVRALYSIVCGNVEQMAKYITIDKHADPTDGKFEIVETPVVSKLDLLKEVTQSAVGSPAQGKSAKKLSFMLMTSTQAQFDGETAWLSKGSTVTVAVQPKALKTLAFE